MAREELTSCYISLRQRLEKLYQECEMVEAELREVERELTLGEIHVPDSLPGEDEAIIDHHLPERRAGQPR